MCNSGNAHNKKSYLFILNYEITTKHNFIRLQTKYVTFVFNQYSAINNMKIMCKNLNH